MTRLFTLGGLALVAGLGMAPQTQAQVFVRAPFVRVQVGGGGVFVRAPFANVFVPPPPVFMGPRFSYAPPVYSQPAPVFVAPAPRIVTPTYVAPNQYVPPSQYIEPQNIEPQPETPKIKDAPKPMPPAVDTPPAPDQTTVPTLAQFAQNFQPKGGNYEVTIISPVTGQPTQVRFTLPDGNPRRVHVRRDEIEFDYGIRRFVRIEFDTEGAIVTSR